MGIDKVVVSHLQYADDTMFFLECSKSNARNLINILKCFELALRLKVNFPKSCLYGVGVNPVEGRGDSKAYGMSIRLVLLKSILNSLPLYYFALFRAPRCVVDFLKSVRRIFFWGVDLSGSKFS
ncbi:uncharacterized protein [Rutidosis leptorrhynchoides]|uniref:uncharacterized protein n=1 Tax=Rutidosis leptorrhynchoides TaxID=125765 RepID=UPI003A99BD58